MFKYLNLMKKLLLLSLLGFIFSTCGTATGEHSTIQKEYAEEMCNCEKTLVQYFNDNNEAGQLLIDLKNRKDKSIAEGKEFDFKPNQEQTDMVGRFLGNMKPIMDQVGQCEIDTETKYAGKKGMQEVMQLQGKANLEFMKKYCPELSDPFFNEMLRIVGLGTEMK